MVMKRTIIYKQHFDVDNGGGVGEIIKDFRNEAEFGIWFRTYHKIYKYRKIIGIHENT